MDAWPLRLAADRAAIRRTPRTKATRRLFIGYLFLARMIAALRFCCVSALTCVLTFTVAKGESISETFGALRGGHIEMLQKLRAGRASASEVSAETERWRAAQRDLLEFGSASCPSALSLDDCLALVSCAESLREFHAALRFARHAARLGPEDNGAYFALIRNLLNCKQLAEAELIVANAARVAHPACDESAAFGLLYAARRTRGDFAVACEHLDRFIDHYCSKLAAQRSVSQGIEVYIDLLKQITDAAELKSELVVCVRRHDETLKRDELDFAERLGPCDVREHLQLIAILRSRFELSCILDEGAAVDRFESWLRSACAYADLPESEHAGIQNEIDVDPKRWTNRGLVFAMGKSVLPWGSPEGEPQ